MDAGTLQLWMLIIAALGLAGGIVSVFIKFKTDTAKLQVQIAELNSRYVIIENQIDLKLDKAEFYRQMEDIREMKTDIKELLQRTAKLA